MSGCKLKISSAAILLLFVIVPTYAQSTKQFWPGTDVFVKLNPNTRLYFNSSRTKENREGTEIDLGASIDFLLKPWARLNRLAGARVDHSKASPLLLRAGYHRIIPSEGTSEDRIVLEATPRVALVRGAVISNRNRFDFRFRDKFSWRYRNRIAVERSFEIHAYEITPYARAEVYYDSSAQKWSRTTETIGCVFPIRKRIEIEPYIQHQNDTSKSPNLQVNALGLTITLRFNEKGK